MNSTSSIITIGREYGSGGRQIGQEVAKYFGIKCYDKELLEHATVRKIVGLDDADVLARRLGHAPVQRCAVPRVSLVNHANPLVTGSIVMQDSRRAIRRAVVDADNLDVTQRLPTKRIQTLRQKPLHVINRNKNRNLWSGHFELLPHQPKRYRPSKPAAFKPNLLSYSI